MVKIFKLSTIKQIPYQIVDSAIVNKYWSLPINYFIFISLLALAGSRLSIYLPLLLLFICIFAYFTIHHSVTQWPQNASVLVAVANDYNSDGKNE